MAAPADEPHTDDLSEADVADGELPGIDAAPVSAWLAANIDGAVAPFRFELIAGGHSNLTYSVTLGEQEMVLRRPPFGSKVKSAHDMGREYHVLSKLHAAYPTPKPLFHCTDESVLQAPFYVMGYVDGVVVRDKPTAEGSPPRPGAAGHLHRRQHGRHPRRRSGGRRAGGSRSP
jgi:aminoglycoside phosphotransferase (APT) family kinase protein